MYINVTKAECIEHLGPPTLGIIFASVVSMGRFTQSEISFISCAAWPFSLRLYWGWIGGRGVGLSGYHSRHFSFYRDAERIGDC